MTCADCKGAAHPAGNDRVHLSIGERDFDTKLDLRIDVDRTTLVYVTGFADEKHAREWAKTWIDKLADDLKRWKP